MLRNRSFEVVSEKELVDAFQFTIGTIYSSIGKDAFYYKNQFNKILFETISLFLLHSRDHQLTKAKVKALHDAVLESEKFWQMSKNATTSTKNINTRLEIINDLFATLNK